MKVVTASFKIPKALDLKMQKSIVHEGYGLKGKSTWINDAIESFLSLEDFTDLVYIADDFTGLNKAVSFRMSAELMAKVEAAVISVRSTYPALEGVKSKIFRASIIQRILQS